jgi:DNA processing protein
VADAAARRAVAAGLAVISGLAAGIDTVAHESTLAAGGSTWAVLGSGVDVPTPISNVALAEEIVASGGGLIAEVPPGTPVGPRQLVARDRIQSGLALAVVICQCEISSGTMHTARFALVQGRLLVVVRPRGPDRAVSACSGNVVLVDPDGCDPALLSATGKTAELIRARRPMADVVIDDPEELAELFERLRSA